MRHLPGWSLPRGRRESHQCDEEREKTIGVDGFRNDECTFLGWKMYINIFYMVNPIYGLICIWLQAKCHHFRHPSLFSHSRVPQSTAGTPGREPFGQVTEHGNSRVSNACRTNFCWQLLSPWQSSTRISSSSNVYVCNFFAPGLAVHHRKVTRPS